MDSDNLVFLFRELQIYLRHEGRFTFSFNVRSAMVDGKYQFFQNAGCMGAILYNIRGSYFDSGSFLVLMIDPTGRKIVFISEGCRPILGTRWFPRGSNVFELHGI